jgi:hypothetical protein
MIGVLIGIGAIALGAKGFSRGGLPVTGSKRLTGFGAKAVGVICILIGLAFIADRVHSFFPLHS